MTQPLVLVFGSNLAARHGKGAGRSRWPQGNAYAIPTKDFRLQTLPLAEIAHYVREFLVYAMSTPDQQFQVTSIGCGLAGYTPAQIAPMFRDAPSNVQLPADFLDALK